MIAVTAIWDVPATPACVILITGAERVKSCIVTGTLTDRCTAGEPPVPVTVTVNGAPPVRQVTDSVAVCAGGSVTLAGTLTVQPAGAPVAVRDTGPLNVPSGVIVIIEVPATVASVVIDVGLGGVWLNVKSAPTLTGIFTSRERVEAAAAVPVTVTVNAAVGRGLHVTETRPAALTVAVQPVG